MGRLRIFSGTDLCRLLGKNGFKAVRQKGSHILMQKAVPGGTITVPVPNHREIRLGTLKSIIRQSQLSSNLFEHP